MNASWKIVAACFWGLLAVSARAGTSEVLSGGDGGSGGGGGTSLPSNWYMNSGASHGDDYSSAWGSIGGETMGIPDSVHSNLSWYYRAGEDLFFTIDFYSSGNVERPTETTYLSTGGELSVNNVTVQQGDDWWLFEFDRVLSINWNGGYSSWLDGNYANGQFNGWASVSPIANLTATPRLALNNWDDETEPRPEWFNDYDASVRITGYIPNDSFTASVVPEPATGYALRPRRSNRTRPP